MLKGDFNFKIKEYYGFVGSLEINDETSYPVDENTGFDQFSDNQEFSVRT